MFYKKSIITWFSLASVAVIAPSVSASNPMDILTESLRLQMERQAAIDIQAAESQYHMTIAERMAAIRARNQERLATLRYQDEMISSSSPVVSPVSSAPITTVSSIQVAWAVVAPETPVHTPLDQSTPPVSQYIGNIDMARVQNAWLEWNNTLRREAGLAPYTLHPSLNQTAQEWSEFSRDRGYITHGRPGDGCTGARNWSCYNYNAVDTWFRDRGVNPVPVARTKHTENLGFGAFNCSAADCTEQAIQAIRKTYNFFYSEKSYNGVHYRSMVNPRFQRIGVGLAHKNGTYYLTIHYTTDF